MVPMFKGVEGCLMYNKAEGIVDKLWDFFSSMKTGLFLLGVIAVSAGIGTLIPQVGENAEKAPNMSEIWTVLGFTHLYTSIWFQFIMGLLSINLVVCSVQRFGIIYQQTFKSRPPKDSADVPVKIQAQLSGEEKILRKSTLQVLRKHGYRVTLAEAGGAWQFIAQKRRWGNWGSFLTHLAFVLLLVGALLGSSMGFKGFISAGVGSTVPIQRIELSKGQVKENFAVKVNAAEDRILPNGDRDNWYTDLSILQGGKEVARQTLSVNHPFTYQGITFYQTQFSHGAQLSVERKGQKIPIVLQNNGGNYYQAPDTDLYLIIAALKADPQDPILLYQVYQGNGRNPVKMGQLKRGQTENILDAYTVKFDGLAAITGLQVKKDPGIFVIWLGSALLLVGLLLSFYWRPLTIVGVWDAGLAALILGTAAGKLGTQSQEAFENLIAKIKAGLFT